MFHPQRPRPYSLFARAALTATSLAAVIAFSTDAPGFQGGAGTNNRVVAWNDLGMHCIDPDFSVFSILPPFNTLNTQVIQNGQLVTNPANITVTYEGEADATGSINTTSIGKTNFWEHVQELYGVSPAPDVGLTGNAMPGPMNIPQPSEYDDVWEWFAAEGIPVTPFDDALEKNPYPLMRVTARTSAGQLIGSTVTTAPNSQELTCSMCHESAGSPFARPSGGWVFDDDPLKDDRWNILRLHDERELGTPEFTAALQAAGYDAAGLEATARGGTSILCARCHGSNALPGTGMPGISPMTQAIHGLHADVVDLSLRKLSEIPDRSSCYTCHPGFDTQCLRGAMGKAIGPDGGFSMECQSCHGNQDDLAAPDRVGWLEQPECANCHTGSATDNSGEIRYTSAFDASGALRTPASDLFGTTPDVPADGFSLYRFSSGHGGLQCSACHGPPHAIYPTNFENDNAQSLLVQGHIGTVTDCTACHADLEDDEIQGPHGMHPVTAKWVRDQHGDEAEHGGTAQCFACHGADGRGSVLSYAQGDRTYNTEFGTKEFWRGFQVGCYACHDGPDDDDSTNNQAPVVPDRLVATPNDVPLPVALTGTDGNGDSLTFRIVSQPDHGTVAISGSTATYLPEAGFEGTTSFTYAAWDGDTNSNLGVVTVTSEPPQCGALSEAYGFGCPGTGGFIPTLQVENCPELGQTAELTIANGLGGKTGLLVVGRDRAQRQPWRGCILRVRPVLQLRPFALSAGGPGDGATTYSYPIPDVVPGNRITLQAFVRDGAPGRRGTFSNAWEIQFE